MGQPIQISPRDVKCIRHLHILFPFLSLNLTLPFEATTIYTSAQANFLPNLLTWAQRQVCQRLGPRQHRELGQTPHILLHPLLPVLYCVLPAQSLWTLKAPAYRVGNARSPINPHRL